jgi:hypothetical protein
VFYKMGIADGVGYKYVWFFLIFCTAIGTGLMSPKIYRELYPAEARSAPLASNGKGNYQSIDNKA